MKKRIVYDGKVYTETDRKIIESNGVFYLLNSDLVNVGGGKRLYRPVKHFKVIDDKTVREIS